MTPELVFLHIPKTAGTSQRHSFGRYYGLENVFWVGKDCPGGIRRYPAREVGERMVLGGHKPLSFYPEDFDPLYCAVLRDPVERAISLYAYYTRPDLANAGSGREGREEMLNRLLSRGIDPESMLNSIRDCEPFRRDLTNMQCAYLSRQRATFRDVMKSMRKQDFLLGTIDQHGLFHQRLGALLDWPEETAVSLNRSQDGYAGPYLQDAELVAQIRELNKEDYKLWDFVTREHRGLYLHLRDPDGRKLRLGRLPFKPWLRKGARQNWQAVAQTFWPARTGEAPPRPRDRTLVSEQAGLLYVAILGPANASARRLMLASSAVANQEAAKQLGLDRVITHFRTGLMLCDKDSAQRDAILGDSRYFKFAIVSEPVARLVNIYIESFVLRRRSMAEGSLQLRLVARIQARDSADREEGISFREFVSAVIQRSPQRQPDLWAPQYLYLQGLPECDKLYRQDQLWVLQKDLEKLKGLSLAVADTMVPRGSSPSIAGEGVVTDGQYADCRPGMLPQDTALWRDKLVDRSLCEQILEYYARDCELYNQTVENEEVPGP